MGDCQSSQDMMKQHQTSVKIQYNGSQFIIPEVIKFDSQSTFTKVQLAARQFCQSKDQIIKKIIYLLLMPQQQQEQLLTATSLSFRRFGNSQIKHKDKHFCKIQEVYSMTQWTQYIEIYKVPLSLHFEEAKHAEQVKNDYSKITEIEQYFKNVSLLVRINQKDRHGAYKKQERQTIQYQVALMLLCAGVSSRINKDKFLIPINIDNQSVTILDLIFYRLKKVIGQSQIPIFINCNQFNKQKIIEHVTKNNYYGISSSCFRFFETYTLALYNQDGKYCINDQMQLLRKPPGTASALQYIQNSINKNMFQKQSIKYVYFSGCQNLLERPCDPVLIGMAHTQKRKIGIKSVRPIHENQKLFRLSLSQQFKKTQIIDNLLFKNVINKQKLNKIPVALNSMVFELESLQQLVNDYHINLFMAERYHLVIKQQKIFDIQTNKFQQQLCYGFQKDIRDLVSCVNEPLILKVHRQQQFAPIYSISQQYSLAAATSFYKQKLLKQVEQWNQYNRLT